MLNMLLYLINLYTAGSSDRIMKDQGVQTEDAVQQGMYILHMYYHPEQIICLQI